MARRHVIRLGDPTTHGGTVVSASGTITINGKNAARIGDSATCPIHGHGVVTIVEGDSGWLDNGRPIALEGHKTSCGASLISTLSTVIRAPESGGAAVFSAAGTAAALLASVNHGKNEEYRQYDEQLMFVSADGRPFSNLDYVLTFGDGYTVGGRTDSEGRTNRVATQQPTVIEKAEFYSDTVMCCERHHEESDTAAPLQVVELSNVTTNAQDIGSSVVTVTAKGDSRSLTAGEIAMAKTVFKDSIDYRKVKVHNRAYMLGQGDNTAMTPDGEMYFKPVDFVEDFSSEVDRDKIWFIHEMAHVWQYQLGYSVRWNGIKIALSGAYSGESAYQYDASNSNKKLSDYNMEQQGDLIAHYFAASILKDRGYLRFLPFLTVILADFLENPKNVALLPN